MLKTTIAKLLTLKVAGVALAATTAGGVAVAAGTGELPTQHGKPFWVGSASPTRGHHKGHKIHKAPAKEAALAGLCRAYLAQTRHHALPKPAGTPKPRHIPTGTPKPMHTLTVTPRPKPSGGPQDKGKKIGFAPLIKAAGGKDKVTAYCLNLLKTHPAGGPSHLPTGSPTGSPSPLPTGLTPSPRPTTGHHWPRPSMSPGTPTPKISLPTVPGKHHH